MKNKYAPEEIEINVMPLIDVLFVLLAIILATATIKQQDALNIQPPRNDIAKGGVKETINISIDTQGTYYINGAKVPAEALATSLDLYSNKQEINIKADKMTSYDNFTKLFVLLNAKKFENINIITEE